LVIGEVVIDEYVYCQGLGKSNKDPILAFNYERSDVYGGGSLAVANHLAGFCNDVSLISYLGDNDRCEDFTRNALHKNVTPCFMTRSNSPTVRKKRYVDSHTLAKVFEVYHMEDTPPLYNEQIALAEAFEEIVQGYDLVIVSDFGHGMMSPPVRDAVVGSNRFLAINTQANAGNRGFNTISKYSRADYVCLAGHEVELETRLKYAPFDELIHEVEKSIDCPRFTITVGKHGTLHNAAGQPFIQVPAFATKVTDRVGAGDAVLAISSLLAYQNAPWNMVGLISNLAGREMVERMGNSGSINRSSLENSLAKLLC
jgi:bifunctional ADP-heptose synthase (sugar kinase/adenylyltransferase)